jgi:hypothetical protein
MNRLFQFAAALLLATSSSLAATTITYQGQLQDADGPYDGQVDLTFTLFTDQSGSDNVGSPLTVNGVQIANGLFQVPLDFGDVAYEEGLWLEIAVNDVPLAERQPVRAAPLSVRTLHPPQGGGDGSTWSTSGSTVYYNDGNVGIGTASPNVPLHVRGDGGNTLFRVQNQSGLTRLRVEESGGTSLGNNSTAPDRGLYVHGDVLANSDLALSGRVTSPLNVDGNMSVNANASTNLSYIRFRGDSGTDVPRIWHNESENDFRIAGVDTVRTWSDFRVVGNMIGNVRVNSRLIVNADKSSDWSYICFREEDCSGPRMFHTTDSDRINVTGVSGFRVHGLTRTQVLQIDGADLAEEFPFSEPVEPGTLVSIDPDNPGQLRTSQSEYDRMVAGIIPGANEFSTGIVLGKGTGNEHAAPVALSGRVYVKAIGTTAIRPGDLLTSSDVPGYAMAASDTSRTLGATIGKAMTALEEGEEGLVLVLVNLQ